MAFEVFKDTRAQTSEFISVNEGNSFGFPRSFLNAHGIKKGQKAVLLYDADENKIAIHFANEDAKLGFRVQIASEKYGAVVRARGFFEKYKIDPVKYAQRYRDFEKMSLKSIGINGEGEAFVIQLKETARADNKPAKGGESSQRATEFPSIF